MSDLFDDLKNLFTKDDKVDSQHPLSSLYMINRFLSMYPPTFGISSTINQVSLNLPSWATSSLMFNLVPKKRVAPRIGYIKSDKERMKGDKWEHVKLLAKTFHCPMKHAEQIYNILEVNDMDVKQIFGNRRKP